MGEDRVTQTETGKGLERSYILKKKKKAIFLSSLQWTLASNLIGIFFFFLNPLSVQVQLSKVLLMAIKYTQKIGNI